MNARHTPSCFPRCGAKRTSGWVWAWLLCLFGLWCHCLPAWGLTKDEAKAKTATHDLLSIYTLAQNQDANYQSAQWEWTSIQTQIDQARAGLLPNVNFTAGKNQQKGQASFGGSDAIERRPEGWNWNMQLTQPLWRPGAWHGLSQSQAQVRQAQYQFQKAQQALILRVAERYFGALVAQEVLRVTSQQVGSAQAQLAWASQNFKVGMGAITDVYEARARVALAKAQYVQAQSDEINQVAQLENLLGQAVTSPLASWPMAHGLPAWPASQPHDYAQEAQTQALEVHMAQAAWDAAQAAFRQSQAAHQPTLDVVVSRSRSLSSGTLSSPADLSMQTQSTQVGVQLAFPLFAGGGLQARVTQMQALRDKAEQDFIAAQRQAALNARQAWIAWTNGQAQLAALDVAVETSEQAFKANQVGFKMGTRINIDVLNAQQQLFNTQKDWHKARMQTVLAYLQLKASAGHLRETDLHTLNALLSKTRS